MRELWQQIIDGKAVDETSKETQKLGLRGNKYTKIVGDGDSLFGLKNDCLQKRM